MSKAVQELFTAIAADYDRLNRTLSLSIDKRWREQALAPLKKLLPQETSTKILDLCAGTLDLTERLLEIFPKAQIFSLDFSLAMLEQGKKKLKASPRGHLLCADGHRLPLPSQSVDAVLCGFGIRNLENRVQAASEIRRILKPGGSLVVLEFFRPEGLIAKGFYQTYGKFVIPRIGGWLAKNRQAYQYLQDSILQFLSVEEYRRLLLQHGFTSFESKSLSGGIVHRVLAQ